MSDMALDYKVHRITVDEFCQMGEAGVFEDRHVELLDGTLVDLSPVGKPHAVIASRIGYYLAALLGERAEVVHGATLPLGEYDAPEPDIAIFAPIAVADIQGQFRREEAYALIEVSDTSLRKDLRTKLSLYARYGIGEYLVVDLNGRILRHFTHPSEGVYKSEERLTYEDRFSLNAFSDIVLDVDSFLPPR